MGVRSPSSADSATIADDIAISSLVRAELNPRACLCRV